MIIEIKDAKHFKEMFENNEKLILDFNATWCGPCRMLKSELEKISLEFKNIKILSINVDNIPELSKKYNIYSIPAIFLVRNKQIVFNHVGFLPKNNLIKVINDLFK